MKRSIFYFHILFFIIAFSSCRNKTVLLLTNKWDCVQVEYIIPPGTQMLSATDSAEAVLLKTLLISLNWTFKKNMQYECAIVERITTQGRYELIEQDKIMVCTPDSKTGIKRYIIKSLSENEMVLSGNADNKNIILHFKPH